MKRGDISILSLGALIITRDIISQSYACLSPLIFNEGPWRKCWRRSRHLRITGRRRLFAIPDRQRAPNLSSAPWESKGNWEISGCTGKVAFLRRGFKTRTFQATGLIKTGHWDIKTNPICSPGA